MLLDLGTHDFDLTRWLTGLSHEQVHRPQHRRRAGGTEAVEVVATLSGGAEATHRVQLVLAAAACAGSRCTARTACSSADTTDPGADPPVPRQLRAFRDLVLGRLDPADAGACASLADGAYAVEVAARAAAGPVRLSPAIACAGGDHPSESGSDEGSGHRRPGGRARRSR